MARSKLTLIPFNVDDARDFEAAFDAAAKERVQGIVVFPSPLVHYHSVRIAALATQRKLPSVFLFAEAAEGGGLISYGPNVNDMSRRAAPLVIRILNGTQPGELPIERPTKFELAINLKTAKTLGLTIPPTLLARADQVIE